MRLAENKDVCEIAKIEKQYIECAWSERLLAESLCEGSYTFVVEECEGEIIGYGGVKIMGDEAEICNVAIKQNHRNRGVATRIMHYIEELCTEKNALVIRLEVNEKNAPAINLYKKCGYQVLAYRKKYYGENNAIVMQRIIRK